MTSHAGPRFLRFAGLCGVVSPVIAFSLIFYAVAISPWFNWHANALSDLGIYPRPSAIPFNTALISGGLFTAVLALGVGLWLAKPPAVRYGEGPRPSRSIKLAGQGGGWLGRLGTATCLIGAVALTLVGVFPSNYGELHWLMAAIYFLVTPVGYVLLGAEMLRLGRRVHGALTIMAGIAAFLAIVFVPHRGLAVPELTAALMLSSRALSMGMKLWLAKPAGMAQPGDGSEYSSRFISV